MRGAFVVCLLSVAAGAFAGDYIVAFKNGSPANFSSTVASVGGRVAFQHEVMAIVSGIDANGAARLGALSGVAEVQADENFVLDDQIEVASAEQSFADATSTAVPSTAAFFARQWNMRSIGADVAWAAGRIGSPNVRVAILDTGIDRSASPHVDLAGLVDYSLGAQFQLDNPACVPGAPFTFGATDDLVFHGTHVAATVSSNARATAGVTSRVRLVPVKVLGLTTDQFGQCTAGSGSFGSVLSGVLYAADIDADVANMSLGGGFTKAGNGRFIGMINRVFNYAHRKGTLIVVAAGNDGRDLDHDGNIETTYCDAPNTVCVSALGPSASGSVNGPWPNGYDAIAGYTNFGRSSINVSAPGGTGSGATNPGGFVYSACSRSAASVGLTICRTGNFIVGANGTSMAAPHVTGLAALIVENVGKDKPSQVKARLQQSADDLGQPGTDPFYGKGKINAPRALGLQ
ncbi:MAG: S8 family serine peptidase [Acidobacteria bacterium]|nr:S8 family serine peptidase [Acidobacteriota bacterium]